MSEWAEMTLGEAMSLNVTAVPVDSNRRYDIVGVLNRGRGLLFREAIMGSETAYKTLNRIGPDQIVYSRLKAFEGAITVTPGELHEVFASQEFPTFTCGHSLLPAYFRLLTTTESLWSALQKLSTGMGGRRERVKPADFLTIRMALPPIAEQRRIVDLMFAVDAQMSALVDEVRVATAFMSRARLALLTTGAGGDWRSVSCSTDSVFDWTKTLPDGWRAETIASVATVRSGATPRRSEQARYFDGGTTPWVKTGDLNEGVLGATDECITSVALTETSVRLLPVETVLVAMYGGFGQIGRTARLGVEATTNQAISALTDLRADVQPAFLHEVLKAGRPKWRRVAASSRKDPNISKRDIEGFDFPLPPVDVQHQVIEVLGVMQRNIDSLSEELTRFRVFRRAVLTSLLNREIEIPESYDELLPEEAPA